MAKLGVFWVHRGQILSVGLPLANSVEDGLFVNYPGSHLDRWPEVQTRWHAVFPELQAFEYEEVPRGRVLFDRRRNRFICYLDRSVDKPELRQRLLAVFELAHVPVVFQHDAHYTTNQGTLDELFKG